MRGYCTGAPLVLSTGERLRRRQINLEMVDAFGRKSCRAGVPSFLETLRAGNLNAPSERHRGRPEAVSAPPIESTGSGHSGACLTWNIVSTTIPPFSLRSRLNGLMPYGRPNNSDKVDSLPMPLLLFHGDSALEIDEAVRAIRDRFERSDVLTLDGSSTSLPALSEACLTGGLFALERLVIAHDLHRRGRGGRRDPTETEEIGRLLSAIPDSTTVILVSRDMPADDPLVRVVRQAGGEVRGYVAPRKHELAGWITQRARTHGATIDRRAAEVLAELAGTDTMLLDSELEKLAVYVGPDHPISPETVELLVGTSTQESIFGLVDAIGAGDAGKARRLLRTQLEQTSSGPVDVALYLIRMLARQMRILLRIRLAQEAGRQPNQIIADLKLPRYYADRYFRQARGVSTQRLRHSFEQLADLDYRLKSGKAEASPGLDLLIVDLCNEEEAAAFH
jgi:DNA polymerase III delta subunit